MVKRWVEICHNMGGVKLDCNITILKQSGGLFAIVAHALICMYNGWAICLS